VCPVNCIIGHFEHVETRAQLEVKYAALTKARDS